VAPRIPGLGKGVGHVAYCRPNGIPHFVQRVTSLGVKDAFQTVGVRLGDRGGHATGPFRPIQRRG
jgi:hypothetical protein